MKQLEIEFFFPLTEQIPLDLDYSQCPPHQYWVRAEGIAGLHGPFSTGTQWVASPIVSASDGGVTIQANQLTIKGQPMPWYRKIIFKLIGFKYD